MERRVFLAGVATGPVARAGRGTEGAGPPAARVVRIGMGQMRVRTGAVEENLARARDVIGRAGTAKCAVVVLPECLDLGWTHPEAARLALPVPGPSSDALGEAARASGLWAVAVSNVGRIEAGPWQGRYCIGSSLAVGPDGAVLARLPYGVDAEVFRTVDVPFAG